MSTTLDADETDQLFAGREDRSSDDPSLTDRFESVAFDEDDYAQADLEADAQGAYGLDESDGAGGGEGALEDGRADENDYSHAEGDPDSVTPQEPASVSDELEEFERGDPT